MEQADREEFVLLLKNSTLFPPYAKQMIAVAFFNNTLSEREMRKLLSIFRQERTQMKKVDDKFQQTVQKLRVRYNIQAKSG